MLVNLSRGVVGSKLLLATARAVKLLGDRQVAPDGESEVAGTGTIVRKP